MLLIFDTPFSFICRETTTRCKPAVSVGDLSRNVIDLAISTIKKTHHSVTIASVPDRLQADKEVGLGTVSKKINEDWGF